MRSHAVSGYVCRILARLALSVGLVACGLCLAPSAVDAQTPLPIDPAYPGFYFADVDSSSASTDSILIFNPHGVAVTARVTFTKTDRSGLSRDIVVSANSRADVNVQAEPGIGGGPVSVAVQSLDGARPLYAEHTQYWGTNRAGGRNTEGAIPAPAWYFAEGLANAYFAEDITIYVLNNETTYMSLLFTDESGATDSTVFLGQVGPFRRTVHVNDYFTGVNHGTSVVAWTASGEPARVVAERTMRWANGDMREGASAVGVSAPRSDWYFAEGGKGTSTTYLALLNPQPFDTAAVQVRYLHENGTVYTGTVSIPPAQRATVQPPAAMPDGALAIHVASPGVPIVADRAVYAGPNWEIGHASTPSSAPDTTWYFAEGQTSSAFDAYLVLANPGATSASVTVTARKTDGTTATHTLTVPANQRASVDLKTVSGLASATFALAVTSTAPIVAERVMYWDAPPDRHGSHASLGMRPYPVPTPPTIDPADTTTGSWEDAIIYGAPISVVMANATAGTSIRYTLDGTEPVESSTLYVAPFALAHRTTVKAKAFKSGWGPSETALREYRFNEVSTPVMSPAPGVYANPTPVTLTCPLAGAQIRYTLDGTEPTSSSTLYSTPIAVATTTTIKVAAFKTGYMPSVTVTGTYKIGLNHDPVAVSDTATTLEDTPVDIAVRANDTDADGDTLTVSAVTQGQHGAVSINANGSVRYAPAANTHGTDSFTYTVIDGNGGSAVGTVSLTITAVNDAPTVTLAATPSSGTAPLSVELLATATDVDGDTLTYAWTFGDGQTTTGSPVVSHVYATAGTRTASVQVSDGTATASASSVVTVNSVGGGETPPPDPSTVAPNNSPTAPTSMGAATRFLYSGATPIQSGVTAGAIDERRVAVVRGKVSTVQGLALSGARVAALGQAASGYTITREDGLFDLAVNGGGQVVLQITRDGYLPAQRRVATAWQDYTSIDEVRLVAVDAVVTTVQLDSAAPAQVARGSAVADADGARQATLIVPAGGVHANIELADGTVLPDQAQLHIRATEYTVGAGGRAAMPGDLPASSGYTYAVELSADEAMQAGARRVTFSPALAFYVENFLGFPVGGAVPAGYYDRARASWVAGDNGRIVQILSIDGTGHAALDIDGSGTPADAVALAALGVTDGERQQLGTLYAVGQSLWRVPIPHFTPWDCNWPFGPPADAAAPNVPEPDDSEDDPDTCEEGGSIIECQNQVLGERLPIDGTSFTLNYRSKRQRGYLAGASVVATLSGASLPASVKRIDVEMAVAGRRWTESFPVSTNLGAALTWDGLDVYGRPVFGRQPATVTVKHVYDGFYYTPASGPRSFGVPGAQLSGDRTRQEISLDQTMTTTVAGRDPLASPVAGWSIDVHHGFDGKSQTLYRGDGGQETRRGRGLTPTTAAGGGSLVPTALGVPAAQANLNNFYPDGLAVGADGRVIMSGSDIVWSLDIDGYVHALPQQPGTGWWGQVAIDAAGTIWRAGYDGIVGYCSEGGSATKLALWELPRAATAWTQVFNIDLPVAVSGCSPAPQSVFGADGALYVSGGPHLYQLRPGETQPALVATVGGGGYYPGISAMAAAPDGSLYVSTGWTIDRLMPSGTWTHIAGTGEYGPVAEGVPAHDTYVRDIKSLALEKSGALLLLDAPCCTESTRRIRRIGTDGIINTIAGGNESGTSAADGAPVLGGTLQATQLTTGPDGRAWIFESSAPASRLRQLVQNVSVPSPTTTVYAVAHDGSELYEFDNGRHIRTLDGATGHTFRTFSYDTAGRLVSIVDDNGLATQIERDGAGAPTAIVAPFGQRTTLTTDANGYLASVTDPTNATTSLTYGTGGLLSGMTTPNQHAFVYTYDPTGRLTSDTDPAGGVQTLGRVIGSTTTEVTLAHNAGFQQTYTTEMLPTGATRSVITWPDGTPSIATSYPDGRRETTEANGVTTVLKAGSDPRYGVEVPFVAESTITMPSGLARVTTTANTATLSEPGNPLSAQQLTTSSTVNGHTDTTVYNAAAHTVTFTSPAGRQVVTTYDVKGRVVQTQVGTLSPTTFTYNALGQLTGSSQGTRAITLGYDASGNWSSTTDGVGHTTSVDFPATSRTATHTWPGSRTFSASFDANGNVVSVTPPDRTPYAYTFTPVDLPESYTPPVVGTPATTTFSYRLDRQLQQITRPAGDTVTFTHDAAGRVQTLAASGRTLTWTYSPTTGLPTSLTGADVSQAFTYDGTLPLEETWSGAVSGTVGTTWDTDFRPATQSVNGAASVTFEYDADGLLTKTGQLTIMRAPATGLITATALGSLTETRGLNGYGEVDSRQYAFGGTPLFASSQMRDAAARVTQSTETIGGVTHVATYGYDPEGRLWTVTIDGVLAATYTYDTNDNRLTHVTTSGTTTSSYDAQDRLVTAGARSYTYTPTGEWLTKSVTAGGTTTYTYDALGNLTQVALPGGTTVSYLIDGSSRRVGRAINGTATHRWIYEGTLRIVAELDATGQVVSRFVHGTASNVPDYMVRGATTYRLVTDERGSVRLVVDVATGTIAQRLDYDAWGVVTTDTNQGFQPFGFAGGLYDPLTGLVRFGARDYDAETGRWTAKDPVGFIDSANLYIYLQNNPVSAIDPTGLSWGRVGCILMRTVGGAGIGAGTGALLGLTYGAPVGALAGGGVGAIPVGAGSAAVLATAWGIAGGAIGLANGLNTCSDDPTMPDVSNEALGDMCFAEHTKGARPSTKGKHENTRSGDNAKSRKTPTRNPPADWNGPRSPWPPSKSAWQRYKDR
jgi:RHS repeat-associated protein